MLTLDDVGWRYPHADQDAVTGLRLQVAAGECVVLCGASGCGKSTVLRLINGLAPHFYDGGRLTGQVRVDGLVTTTVDLDVIGRRTGTVQQHPRRQFFTDTIGEEIAFAMENFGCPREQTRREVAEQLAHLERHMGLQVPLTRLSGGQQQQVAIAASTAHRPGVLLLDEPSSNLSAAAVERLQETLRRCKDAGMTIVIAEHRLRYLADLLDRVVVLADGVISAEWDAQTFAATSDDELRRMGLRGDVAAAELPTRPAAGPAVADGVDVSVVPDGALELREVVCRAGGRTILDLRRLTLPRGQVTAIRGGNGVGKTTLTRVVAGLRRATGQVRLDGRVLRPRARRRACALVMQDVQRQLFTESVRRELDLAGLGPTTASDAAGLLSELGLARLEERHPLSLSGGQQQRLVVAAARLSGRPVVIFDEPSSGVDRRHLTSIADQIRQVAAGGAVTLLISHDEDLLSLAADEQVTLRAPAGSG
ncbi:ABC transporter ATP-binding protein [Arsenicicoccus dermatophilus]|uniref:ABC transporter ATP-binding protein n=1 Tax=Arsenicicoccus dermatophilus TaxID=1076331 RepID=UPI001F4CE0F0|nr:ABC transporter ATP-binding protein [Arsenicicoccus dermatophilus]